MPNQAKISFFKFEATHVHTTSDSSAGADLHENADFSVIDAAQRRS